MSGAGWQPEAPLNVARFGAAGAELGGAVYVAGGWADVNFQTALADAERLLPSRGGWQMLPPMPTRRGNPAGAWPLQATLGK